MKLLVPLLAVAGLSGCVAYGGDPYYSGGPVYSTSPYYSSGSVYYGNTVPYTVQTAPTTIYEHRRPRGERDRDRDGIPNRLDRDRDGDGVPNRLDARPNNPRRH
jgi:hypothetical protein